MRAVWIGSRNDAIGNVTVIAAAVGVLGIGTMWPDLVAAAVLAGLTVPGRIEIIRHSREDVGSGRVTPQAAD